MKGKYLSEKFQTSTLTRFIDTSTFLKKTGFKVSGAALQYEIPKDEFLRVILRIFGDIANETITARNDVKERSEYISDIFEEITTGKRENNAFEAEPSEPKPGKQEPRKPKPRKRTERLIPDTLEFNTGSNKLNELIKEGQKMSVGAYPRTKKAHQQFAYSTW